MKREFQIASRSSCRPRPTLGFIRPMRWQRYRVAGNLIFNPEQKFSHAMLVLEVL